MASASEMARLTNIPTGRLLKAIRAGAVTPDSTCLDGRLFLFRPERVSEIQNRVNTLTAIEPADALAA